MASAEIVGWAWMLCLHDATACCSVALLGAPLPVAAPPAVAVAGVEGARASVVPVAGARPNAGLVLEGVLWAVRVLAAGPFGAAADAAAGFDVAGLADVPVATRPARAVELVRAAARWLAAGVEPV